MTQHKEHTKAFDLFDLKSQIESDPQHWSIHLMDFVDGFRRKQNVSLVERPFPLSNERIDALLASTAEYLCDEATIKPPDWLVTVPACKYPWFVAGIENLKAIALAESPLRYRIRKIFVLSNFLDRV